MKKSAAGPTSPGQVRISNWRGPTNRPYSRCVDDVNCHLNEKERQKREPARSNKPQNHHHTHIETNCVVSIRTITVPIILTYQLP